MTLGPAAVPAASDHVNPMQVSELGRLRWPALLLLLCLRSAWAQAPVSPADPNRAGLQITRLSAYAGDYFLPAPAGSTRAASMVTGGWSADVGWHAPSRRFDTFVAYHTAYNQSRSFSAMNGFDHALSVSLRLELTRRLSLSVEGQGESVLASGFLFEPSRGLYAEQQNPSFDRLGSSLSGNASTSVQARSPLALTLFGTRRREVRVGTGLTFQQSPRLTWRGDARVTRTLPTGQDERFAASGLYPASTLEQGTVGVSYSRSRRTQLGTDFSYFRSYSAYSRSQLGTWRNSIRHALTPRWFVQAEAGLGALRQTQGGTRALSLSYLAGGGIGTETGAHTLRLGAERQIADRHGLGAGSTVSIEAAWSWHRPRGAWTWHGRSAYERLMGGTAARIHGWVGHVVATRQITKRTSLQLAGAYASDTGSLADNPTSLTRRGARVSFLWVPRPPRLR